MAAELTAVLSADSSQLQKSLNNAKSVLNKYKKEVNSTTQVNKAQIDSFNKSVNSLNKLTNSAKTNKQQMSGLKKQLIELSTQYNALSTTAKKSDFGKALANTIKETQNRYTELKKTVDDVNKSLNETTEKTKSVKGVLNQISNKTLGIDVASFTKVGAAVGAVGLVANEFKRSSEMAVQFEDALSNLSAITGLKGGELESLKKQIIDTGNATSKAFSDIADSYTKVGSKMPELLKQPKALDEVTRAVITLSKAARMTVDESTDALLGIMNQMGASANEAAIYINVLAAGSKNGAGDIKYLAEAFNQCGTASSTAGLTIQQATALIEVLAQKIPNASTAGTNLRNILLKLATDTDNSVNPTVVGLQTALENLAKKADDTAYMTKKFGTENVSAAITLAQSASKADELTQAVTGTNEAEQQAKTQTDNVAGAVKKLTQDWDNFITELNNSQGAIKTVIGLLDDLIKSWQWALSAKNKYEDAGDRGKEGASSTSDNYKQKAFKSNKNAKSALAQYKKDMQFSIDNAEKTYRKLIADGVSADKKQQEILYNAAHQAKVRAEELKKQLKNASEADFVYTNTPSTSTGSSGGGRSRTGGSNHTTKTISTNQQAINDYKATVQNLNALIKDGLISQTEYDISLVKEQNTLLSKLEKNWVSATDAEKQYYNTIATEKTTNLKNSLGGMVGTNITDSFKTNIEFKPLKEVDTQIDTINEFDEAIKKLTDDLGKLTIGSKEFNEVQAQITTLQTKKNEALDEGNKQNKNNVEGIYLMSNAMGSLSKVMDESSGAWLGFASNAIVGITDIIPKIVALIGAKQGEALASGTASAAKLPFPANLGAIASIVATIASVFASLPTFADGGVFGGNTTIGDYNLARVNKGEMILNGSQQKHLFDVLNSGGGINNTLTNGHVEFKIKGDELVGALRNYNKKQSKL